ncbi:MAG: cyclic pyranopterin monophosphate synthase MoaC [Thermodesulfobacteriota bacterium]
MSRDQDTGLTHLDGSGRARMVDVGDKEITTRRAKARGEVVMSEETLRLITAGDLKKGDALGTARLAGIMAAKKTADLIPLCHPLALSHVEVNLTPLPGQGRIEITTEVRCEGRTGVEMEALTAAAAAALTIYDMAKAVDRGLVISEIKLLEKSGGRSGTWRRET